MNKYTIIHNLIILTQKQKIKHKITIYNKQNLLFLNFLWINNFIYGYTFLKQTSNSLIIYLKKTLLYDRFICYNLKQININVKDLKKQSKWLKNSFFIIRSIKGLISIKTALIQKVGGFLLYKLY